MSRVCGPYTWWLLPRFMKPDESEGSLTRAIVMAIGEELDLVRAFCHAVRDEILTARSTGQEYEGIGRPLDLHGMERGGTARYAGEGDEGYQDRVMAALAAWREYGRSSDMAAMLESLGFEASIVEPDWTAWSRLRVCLTLPSGPPVHPVTGEAVTQQEIYRLVNHRRPSHKKILYRDPDIGMAKLRMDGSWMFDEARRLPEWIME